MDSGEMMYTGENTRIQLNFCSFIFIHNIISNNKSKTWIINDKIMALNSAFPSPSCLEEIHNSKVLEKLGNTVAETLFPDINILSCSGKHILGFH